MGYFLTILVFYGRTAISSVGIHLVFSLGGIFFLGMPSVVKVGAYTIALAEKQGMSGGVSFFIALSISFLCGLMFAWLFMKVSADSFAVLSLASILAIEALLRSWDTVTNGVLGISGIKRPDLFSTLPSLAIGIIVVVIVLFLMEFILLQTWIGRALRAYKQDEISLQALGVPTMKLAQAAILIASILAGISGIFMAWHIQYIDPMISGIPFLIEVITIGILSLKPKVRSVALMTLLVIVLPESLKFIDFPTSVFGYMRTFSYSIVLIFLILKLSKQQYITKRNI